MPAILDIDTPSEFSTNDSHIHLDLEAPAKRARLRTELKPGETDEVLVPGPRQFCQQCNPDGTLPQPARPSNATYDRTFAARKQDETDAMKREIAELREMLNLAMADKVPKKSAKSPE